ncbi:hypothetical protein BJ322DRAFT_1168850 [Thelephora terrestris]|uniref:Glycine-rich domain-containing protein 1 n=1 Tax=Thelephora terrestris TaxID=56493 RepID=A0A9P6LAN0_9AGAM|nr:hypothetical protein BJ322DRAFT_1168850 [Thelephora terrestris]
MTAPPQYTDRDEEPSTGTSDGNLAPPPYHLEQLCIPVGGTVPKVPFVSVSQLRVHLGLLRAFRELRNRVTDLEANPEVREKLPPLAQELEPSERWTWFLELALERFHRWVSKLPALLQPNNTLHNPPLDVWLIWHAYLLNPIRYAEDLLRVRELGVLKTLAITPIDMLEIMGNISQYKPQNDVLHSWEEATGLPWDPLDCCTIHTRREVVCPKCGVFVIAPYLTPEKTGLAQEAFTCVCESCGFSVTRENLLADKFVKDLVKDPKNLDDVGRFGDAVYLPGTLLTRYTRSRQLDKNNAKLIKASIYASKNLCYHLDERHKRSEDEYSKATDIVAWADKIKTFVEYKLDPLTKELSKYLRAPMLRKVMGAYTDDRPYSLDLVSAVRRQETFTEKMHNLGWSQPGFFDSTQDEIALIHCIARYHAFLDLISSSPYLFFVPTLDIDIAWHTHQLLPEEYMDDCVASVGRFVNHDDNVEEGRLASSFEITCRLWRQRFGVPYTYCGCPLPGDTIGMKLGRLAGSFLSRKQTPVTPPNRDDSLLATHPSDHNAVYVQGVSHTGRERRAERSRGRKKGGLKKFKKPQMGRQLYNRDRQHDVAFLIPVPLYYGAGVEAGFRARVVSRWVAGAVGLVVLVAEGGRDTGKEDTGKEDTVKEGMEEMGAAVDVEEDAVEDALTLID